MKLSSFTTQYMFLSNIAALLLAVAITGMFTRGKRGPLIMLFGAWLIITSYGLVHVAGDTTDGEMSTRKLFIVAGGGIVGVLSGLGLLWLGAVLFGDDLAMAKVKITHIHRRNRHNANLELAVIDGELSDQRPPAAPMYRTKRHGPEEVEFETKVGDFPLPPAS